ncbi:dependent RNA helicase [Seminavis robusta]|uniref:RNA helicase n=1 Tax=Seminavis robusta TaxID=568900 RepID=A0A9N8DN55_9STRA|nr:dependent RNA helicase [Seminavis robusta]|eukprot:Sro253_g099950.1 dependent RNA helicase (811) ;mRNA; f:55904-58463
MAATILAYRHVLACYVCFISLNLLDRVQGFVFPVLPVGKPNPAEHRPAVLNSHHSDTGSAIATGISSSVSNSSLLQDRTVKELWQLLEDADRVEPGLKSQLRRKQDIIDYIEQQPEHLQEDADENPPIQEQDEAKEEGINDASSLGEPEGATEESVELSSFDGHLSSNQAAEVDNVDDNDNDAPSIADNRPSNIDPDIAEKIPPFLAEKMTHKGIQSLLPIQVEAFQRIFEGKDAVLQAPTGSGKTLAYVLPLVSRKPTGRRKKVAAPLVLVLVPSRELARQVGKEYSKYLQQSSYVTTVYGGVPLERHIGQLKKNKPLVVVGTPGRLRELVREGHLDYSQITTLVLDESDTLLDRADSPDVRAILGDLETAIEHAPERSDNPEYQLLLVSATMNQHVVEFARELEIPSKALICVEGSASKVLVEHSSSSSFSDEEQQQQSAKESTTTATKSNERTTIGDVPSVQHWHMSCKANVRPSVALDLISIMAPRLTIVFVASKLEAESVASFLSTKLRGVVRVLHGDMVQSARSRNIALIREMTEAGRGDNTQQVLVATDVASRGIDLAVDLVVQFGVPRISGKDGTFSTELYTHRTGRTGRFSSEGPHSSVNAANAVLLYDPAVGEGKLIPILATEVRQELGIELQPKQLPSSAEVVAAGYERTKQSVSLGDSSPFDNDLFSYFRQVIETEEGVDTSDPEQMLEYLSRAMALLSNLDPAISPFRPHASLLSGNDADRTLRLYRNDQTPFTPPEVIKICKQWGSGKLGRVVVCQDGSAVFDLPRKRAMRLLESAHGSPDDSQLELPLTLPDLCS